MELHQIRYFLAVAETGNFSRAAQNCHVSQPSLSRAIKKLEDELGGPLFERRPGRVVLTELGGHMHPHMRSSYEGIAAVRREAADYLGEREQTLRLGIAVTVFHTGIVCSLGKLTAKYPHLHVFIEQAPPDKLTDLLLGGKLDVCIIPDYPSGTARSQDVSTVHLYRERYCIASAEEPNGGAPAAPCNGKRGALVDTRFAATAEKGPIEDNGPKIRYTAASHCFARALVEHGLGQAIVPEFASVPGLVLKPLNGLSPPRQICLATVRGRPQSLPVRAFVRLLRAVDDWSGTTGQPSACP
jgi:DNA-binding transcriptional LysR family regulator